MVENVRENVIEWIKNDETATVTLCQRRYISKVRKLAEEYPDEVQIITENPDGSIMAHIPVKAVKINIVKHAEITEENLTALREGLEAKRRQKFSSESGNIKRK